MSILGTIIISLLIVLILLIIISYLGIIKENFINITELTHKINEGNNDKISVNDFLQSQTDISTKTTCDPNISKQCIIDGMPPLLVDKIIANVQEDTYYKRVFKNSRAYKMDNVFTNPSDL